MMNIFWNFDIILYGMVKKVKFDKFLLFVKFN